MESYNTGAEIYVPNGADSPRSGQYLDFTDAQMMRVRRKAQKKAPYRIPIYPTGTPMILMLNVCNMTR